jgi:hypothetical protein
MHQCGRNHWHGKIRRMPGLSRSRHIIYLKSHTAILVASAPHEPRWSVPSTVRQLNEPKISHFDQLGCSRIGRKTAKEFHCDAVLYGAAEPIGESFSHCVLASLAKQRSIPFR